MRSVADMPPGDDADDELSGISPELVLVDPELARLVRERESSLGTPVAPASGRRSALRLVPAPESEPAIVPRPAPSPSGEPTGTEEPEPARTVVPPEPTPAVEPPRRAIPPPLAEPVRRSVAVPPSEVARRVPPAPGAIETVMPHPLSRPASAPRPARAARPSRRWRRVLALLGGVAAASLAVLGVLQLTDGPSETAQTVAGPQALGTAPGPRPATPKPKPGATKTGVSAKKRPAATSPPRRNAVATPKARSTARSKIAPLRPSAKTKRVEPSTLRQSPRASGKTSAPTPTPTAVPAVRRFAWAPVAGAIGYHVELFRGAERVLARETKQPALELGRTWRYGGRTLTLTPGSYRWYVWAVTKRGRATSPVVQATLNV